MKVESVILTDLIRKSRYGDRTVSHVYPRSASFRAQTVQTLPRSYDRWFGCAIVTPYRRMGGAM
jgi:hypothetical protein